MENVAPFERHSDRYEAWFERHSAAYQSELAAVGALWPAKADGVEIGVGAGHFAAPLAIAIGVEPSAAMRRAAARRGIQAVGGIAELLPFSDGRFDAALMATTICFVNDPALSVREMFRVLRSGGSAVVGFVDGESRLGREYARKRATSLFYGAARFFSVSEVTALLTDAGFVKLAHRQTLFTRPDGMLEPDPVRAGYGDGSFVVVRGIKQ
ncbi:MAG: methyltransferase domain-containing protein [Vicinamibacteria bacterium]|nr:methyltransferase domain-containing protein [Vicinamibacteria bacterium]